MNHTPDTVKSNPRTIALVLAVCTLLAYYPVLQCGFINYDDLGNVTMNNSVNSGLSFASIG